VAHENAHLVVCDANETLAIGVLPKGDPNVIEPLLLQILHQIAKGLPFEVPGRSGLLQSAEVGFVFLLVDLNRSLGFVQLGRYPVQVSALDQGSLSGVAIDGNAICLVLFSSLFTEVSTGVAAP
jgi:hypothetical protein